MHALERALREKKLLVADGAWGTELNNRGLPTGVAPELWNLENPDAVRSVAAAYVEAGADIVITNTFGGNGFKLAKADLANHAEEVNRRGVELSREAAGDKALVLASLGPTGEFLEPLGETTEEEMIEIFAHQARACAAGNPDGFVVETMTDLGEAKAALAGALQASDLPVIVSMTFDKGATGYATMMGVTPTQAATELDAAGATMIGTNCGAGIVNAIEIVALLREGTAKPIWAKPNAGLPELVNGETVFRQTPEETVAYFPLLVEAGAHIVGGCCGTTPTHIAKLDEARDNLV